MKSRRAAIDKAMLAWMNESDPAPDDERFAATALELFEHQFAHCKPYARFCAQRGRTPSDVEDWREIPAVPTGAFKELALRGFAPEAGVKTFRTSGTSTERRGELHLDTLALYEASLMPTIRRLLFPDLAAGARTAIRVLAPSADEAPDSSLSHMLSCVVRSLGDASSGFDVRGGSLRSGLLLDALARASVRGQPVSLCGTAFAFVHLVDELAAGSQRFDLPAGSRVMETGGLKGRSRELDRDTLYALIAEHLGIEPARVVNQYGMTELASQFYDSILVDPSGPRRKLGPPWARVRIVDPETGADARDGAVGMIVVHDLANTGSIAAIESADLGFRLADGFEVIGRAPYAEARGCGVAADTMLSDRA